MEYGRLGRHGRVLLRVVEAAQDLSGNHGVHVLIELVDEGVAPQGKARNVAARAAGGSALGGGEHAHFSEEAALAHRVGLVPGRLPASLGKVEVFGLGHVDVDDAGDDDEEMSLPDAPVIVAEMRVDIPESTVSDAVMLMDLRNTPALLFKNTGTGRHNMVYRGEDGTIGWVEPKSAP